MSHFVVWCAGKPVAFYEQKDVADAVAAALGVLGEVSEQDGPVPSNAELAGRFSEEVTGRHVPHISLVRALVG